ncbi:MAG: FHA domain-containing protein [Gammaproteobacteria bacterium]|nr:FHA domain-containing protein [Gammaproteobacteria bacterium]
MAKLIVSFKGAVVSEVPLAQGEMLIGRRPDCQIPIDSLAISGYHAKITTVGHQSVLEDLNSTNGTFVDDRPITRHELADGDLIRMGKHTLAFEGDESAETDYEQTMVLDTAAIAQLSRAPAAAPPPVAVSTAAVATLQILNGPRSGATFELTKSLTNIGKTGAQAAVITRRGGLYYLAHLGGDHSPVVNGSEIGEASYQLNDGDILEIGTVKVQFFLRDQA